MRASRFRLSAGCYTWHPREDSDIVKSFIVQLMGPNCVRLNSCQSFGRDLTRAEINRCKALLAGRHPHRARRAHRGVQGPNGGNDGDGDNKNTIPATQDDVQQTQASVATEGENTEVSKSEVENPEEQAQVTDEPFDTENSAENKEISDSEAQSSEIEPPEARAQEQLDLLAVEDIDPDIEVPDSEDEYSQVSDLESGDDLLAEDNADNEDDSKLPTMQVDDDKESLPVYNEADYPSRIRPSHRQAEVPAVAAAAQIHPTAIHPAILDQHQFARESIILDNNALSAAIGSPPQAATHYEEEQFVAALIAGLDANEGNQTSPVLEPPVIDFHAGLQVPLPLLERLPEMLLKNPPDFTLPASSFGAADLPMTGPDELNFDEFVHDEPPPPPPPSIQQQQQQLAEAEAEAVQWVGVDPILETAMGERELDKEEPTAKRRRLNG